MNVKESNVRSKGWMSRKIMCGWNESILQKIINYCFHLHFILKFFLLIVKHFFQLSYPVPMIVSWIVVIVKIKYLFTILALWFSNPPPSSAQMNFCRNSLEEENFQLNGLELAKYIEKKMMSRVYRWYGFHRSLCWVRSRK